MLNISRKVGFSETAFVSKSDKANFKVRFFSPTQEVDLCGHATIATYFLMWKERLIKAGEYTQETKAGILGIEVKEDGAVFMDQNPPKYFEILDKSEIAVSLNIPVDYINDELPVQIVSTGLKDIFIPIKSSDYLFSIKPDLEKISDVCRKNKAIGYHVFTLETKFNDTAHCRNFAPLCGIPEESATGTSNGALACYLFKYKKINDTQFSHLSFEQGYSMDKPSEILVRLDVLGDKIRKVKVGGRAIASKELEVEV